MNRLEQLFTQLELPMFFSQFNFWLFFIILFFIFATIEQFTKSNSVLNSKAKAIFFTLSGLFFYAKFSGVFVVLLLLFIVFNFSIGKAIGTVENRAKAKRYLILACVLNILLLAYFKYAYFFTQSFNQLFHTKYHFINYFLQWSNSVFATKYSYIDKMILPIGISFFTFQSIAYLLDVYRKTYAPVLHFFDFAFLLTFFPKLLLGPLVKANQFIAQLHQPYALTKTDFGEAIVLIAKGLIKKIIFADYIAAQFIDKVFASSESYPGFVGVIALWAYSLQIYADFSGYTDIASGISKLFGFQLPSNFKSPYKAISVADFWRRWHQTLGAWWREYLYIPLGGNKGGTAGTYICLFIIAIFLFFITGWLDLLYIYTSIAFAYIILYQFYPKFQTSAFRDMNLLIVMIFGGLWHGASLNFVIWGTLNGIALVFYNYWKNISPYEKSADQTIRFFRILLTFNFISFTRIWFVLQENEAPTAFLNHLYHHFDFTLENLTILFSAFWIPISVIALGLQIHWLADSVKQSVYTLYQKSHFLIQVLGFSTLIFLLYQVAILGSGGFVYFKF